MLGKSLAYSGLCTLAISILFQFWYDVNKASREKKNREKINITCFQYKKNLSKEQIVFCFLHFGNFDIFLTLIQSPDGKIVRIRFLISIRSYSKNISNRGIALPVL